MRVFDCDCGEQLTATDDERLTDTVQEHFEQAHPGKNTDRGHVRSLVSDEAYTEVGEDRPVGGGPAP
jgi:hypothetical protein